MSPLLCWYMSVSEQSTCLLDRRSVVGIPPVNLYGLMKRLVYVVLVNKGVILQSMQNPCPLVYY